MSATRLLILVTLVSALVWVYAESESLRADTMTVDVELLGGSEALHVMPDEGARWSGRVTIRVRGSTASLDRLRDRLGSPVALAAASDELPREPGIHRVELIEALRRDDVFRGSGVSIESAEPETIDIAVRALEWRELAVQAEAPPLRLASPAASVPARVRVAIPRELAERLEGRVRAIARVDAARLERGEELVPGQEATLGDVPVRLEPEWIRREPGVAVDPPSVGVRLTVASGRSEYTISSMPVRVAVPAVSAERVRIEVPDDDLFLEDVRLVGPSSAIDRLRRGDRRPPMALVALEADQLAAISSPTELQVQPQLTDLPPEVEVGDALPLIRILVSPRDSGSEGQGSEGDEGE